MCVAGGLLYSREVSSDEEARSTERPPARVDEPHPDIAGAIQRAKTSASLDRHGPPAATAKIDKFDLAQALALTTADGEHVPSSSKPPRDDDAPFVPGEVEVVGEEEVHSGVPSGTRSATAPPEPSAAKDEITAIVPRQSSGNVVLIALGVLIGVLVMAYVYVTTR